MGTRIPQNRLEYLTKRAWIFLLASFIVFLISLWYGPKSLLFLSCTVIIGFIFSILTIVVWKWETNGAVSWLLSSVDTFALVGGHFILRYWAFPEMQVGPLLWLAFVQYFSLVLTIFFAFIWLFGARISRYLYPRDYGVMTLR
jgi:hypothetical protein